MEFKKKIDQDVVICSLSGEININTSPQLRKSISELIEQKVKKLILDFGLVTYIDSSGLATLVEILRKIKRYEGRLRLCNLSEKVHSIFQITKLTKLFEIFDTEDAAKAGF